MSAYVLSALAVIVLGVAARHIWQARNNVEEGDSPQATPIHDPSRANDDAQEAQADAENAPADRQAPQGPAAWFARLGPRIYLIGAAGIAAIAVAALALRSGEEASAEAAMQPGAMGAAAGSAMASADNLPSVDDMIDRLAARLKDNPEDGEGFRMLGWSYVMTDRPELAIEPYRRALELLPDSARVHSGYGEALVAIANKRVTQEAKAHFDAAVKLDPNEPRARYFLALWKAQNGKEQEALDDLVALSNQGPGDAPWQDDVRRDIDRYAARLGINVSERLRFKPAAAQPDSQSLPGFGPPPLDPQTIAAANALPEAERETMIDGMVERLAARLEANPGNPDGWVMLLRSRMVRSEAAKARGDLERARKALGGNPAGLAKVNAAARDLKIEGP